MVYRLIADKPQVAGNSPQVTRHRETAQLTGYRLQSTAHRILKPGLATLFIGHGMRR